MSTTCVTVLPVCVGTFNQMYGAVEPPVEAIRTTELSVGLLACTVPLWLLIEIEGLVADATVKPILKFVYVSVLGLGAAKLA